MIKKVLNAIIKFSNDLKEHDITVMSSSIAFFFFVSMFPALMFLCSFTPILNFSENDIIRILTDFAPEGLADAIVRMVHNLYASSSHMLPIAAIGTLWSAAVGVLGLIRGLNRVHDIEDNRNYFLVRILAAFYTLIILVLIILSMVLVVFGKGIGRSIVSQIPEAEDIVSLLIYLRFIFVFLIFTIVLALAYTFLPAKKQKILKQLPGALFASLAWNIITWAFSVYIEKFNGFSVYGNLMAIVVVLLWFYFCFNTVLIGALINNYYDAFLESKRLKSIDNNESLIENK